MLNICFELKKKEIDNFYLFFFSYNGVGGGERCEKVCGVMNLVFKSVWIVDFCYKLSGFLDF